MTAHNPFPREPLFGAVLSRHEQARRKPCPDCGATNHVVDSHPLSIMVTCRCGARSCLHSWLAGEVDMRPDSKGKYSRPPRSKVKP
jgi:hypothetical protein